MAQSGISTYVVLDTDGLKIAQGRQGRPKPVLSALIARKIGGLSDDAICSTLQKALATLPHKTQEIELLIPRHFVILRTLDLPSHDDVEIRELAGFQAVKQTPYALDEIVLDVQVLQKDSSEFSKVLLVVAQKNLVDRLLRITDKANLKVGAIRLSTEGHEAAFLAAQAKTSPSDQAAKGFLSIDYSRGHFCVFHGGKSRYSRAIPLGWKNVNGAVGQDKVFQQKIADEIDLSANAYRKENPTVQIRSIWLENSPKGWDTLSDNLRSKGYGSPAFFNLMELFHTDAAIKIDLEPGMEICRSDVLGGLLMPKHLTLDLLPEDRKGRCQSETRRRTFVQSMIFSGILLALCLLYFTERVVDKTLYLHQLQEKINAIKSKTEIIEAKNERLEVLQGIAKNQGEVIRVIQELYQLLPPTISLVTVSYERGHALTIKGTAKDLSDVFQIIPVLEKSPYFENVTSQYASKRQVLDKEFTDFQIQCIISKVGAVSKERS